MVSKYTTQIRFICENLSGLSESEGYNSVHDVLEKSWDKVFSFDFPIYKESYREVLCKKILTYFYTREIGYETYGRWKLALESRMNIIMPYYNKLYKVIDEQFELLKSQDLYIEHTLSRTESMERDSKTSTSSDMSYKSRFLDTPQGGLDGLIDSDYLTNATLDDTEDSTSSSFTEEGGGKTSENWDEHRYGYEHPYEMLEKYTQERYNIDYTIIMELEPLFMSIY